MVIVIKSKGILSLRFIKCNWNKIFDLESEIMRILLSGEIKERQFCGSEKFNFLEKK